MRGADGQVEHDRKYHCLMCGVTGGSHDGASGESQALLGADGKPNAKGAVSESSLTFGTRDKAADGTFATKLLLDGEPLALTGSSTVDDLPNQRRGSGPEQTAEVATPPKPSWRDLGFVLIDPNFWLLNVTFFTGCGGGLVIINNIAQMVQSLSGGA